MQNEMLKKNASILIILMGSLGDIVRGLSLLPAIKKERPDIKVSWLVDLRWKNLLENNPLIDELIILLRPVRLTNIISITKKLRSRKFDCVLDLQRILKSGLLSFLTGTKKRVAFNKKNTKEFNHFFNTEEIKFFSDSFPKINHYHEFLKYLNIHSQEPYTFKLDYLKSALPVSLDLKQDTQKIALVLESSWESKNWENEHYLSLTKLLLEKEQYQIFLLGTGKSVNLARILSALSVEIVNLVAKTNLKELAAVIAQMDILVGPDSGPGHLAAAFNIPYISLFGPTHPDRVSPYRMQDFAIKSSVSCSPCNKKHCPLPKKICMKQISPASVITHLSSLSPLFEPRSPQKVKI